jgi:glycosyltransferase involved in cell wall biosynthesis
MRIGIDAHAIGSRTAGNETYIKNLIAALAEIDSENQYVLFFTSKNIASEWAGRFKNFGVHLVRPHNRYLRIPVSLPLAVMQAGVDLLHVQYTAPPVCSKPVVTTIHDLSFEHLPEFYTPRERYLFHLAISFTARRAARILTVSEYSRQDLLTTYKLSPEKVVVTPDAIGSQFGPVGEAEKLNSIRKKYGIEKEYLLSVGTLQPRKNFVRLIKAYDALRSSDDEFGHQLVIVGKKGWLYHDIFRVAQGSRYLEDIRFTGYVDDDDLPGLYSGAAAFVYPSIFEGFGLPVLEAMACGTPVVTSNSSSLPEVVGDAGLTVDPYDELALQKAIQRVVFDEALRKKLVRRGLAQAQKFSWQQTAEMTLKVYQDVLHGAGTNEQTPLAKSTTR